MRPFFGDVRRSAYAMPQNMQDWQFDGLHSWWPLSTMEGVTISGADVPRWANLATLAPRDEQGQWTLRAGTATGNSRAGNFSYDPVLGPCMYFQGTNQWILTANTGLNLTTFTLAAWVRPGFTNATGNQAYSTIFGKPINDNSFVDPYWYYYIGTDNGSPAKFRSQISTGVAGSGQVVTGTTTLSSGTAYHVASTYDGTNFRIYINGVQEASSAPAITIGTANTITIVGYPLNVLNIFQNCWLGNIGELRIYTRALSAAEVWLLYAPETRWSLYQSHLPGLYPTPMTITAGASATRYFFAA